MIILKKIFPFALIFIHMCSFAQQQSKLYKENYRPRFHFSPAENWMNDPNGLLFYKNQYHLFYQSNPLANVWGHMSWSHSISNDLLHWKHLPVAIKEEKGIMIFSGTCVADINNSSGFGTKENVPLVAVYTGNSENLQTQNIAFSLDEGITWKKYSGNPVLDIHEKDFRDPKIFWSSEKKYWIMALMLSAQHKVQFYKSDNLLKWDLMSEFGPAGDTSGVWECPDLFKVSDKNNTYKKWILTMSVNGSMQYFAGSFDGINFRNENDPSQIFRVDEGPDYYAAISYNNLPSAKSPVMIGWINNWYYANNIPVSPWKGAMSLPREINVMKEGKDFVLLQQPVNNINSLRKEMYASSETLMNKEFQLPVKSTQLEAEIIILPSVKSISGIKLANGNDHFAEIGYDASREILYLDRGNCGRQDFDSNFKKINHFETHLSLKNDSLRLTIFFDNSIIEVFANNGEKVMTAQVFPDKGENGITLFCKNGAANFSSVKVYEMKSVWQ